MESKKDLEKYRYCRECGVKIAELKEPYGIEFLPNCYIPVGNYYLCKKCKESRDLYASGPISYEDFLLRTTG